MKRKENNTYEIKLYIGSKEGYNGEEFSKEDLVAAIQGFQHELTLDHAMPVRISPTSYMFDNYYEEGWEIGLINYPRKPRSTIELTRFMERLASFLLEKFKQNRITVVHPNATVMYESETAEEKHE